MKPTLIFVRLATVLSALSLKAAEEPQIGSCNEPKSGLECATPQIRCAVGDASSSETFADESSHAYIGDIQRSVHLTDGQRKEIREIIRSRIMVANEILARDEGKRRDALTALFIARKSGDKAAIARARMACDDAFAPERNAYRKSEDKLDDVLTSEQREKVGAGRTMEWAKIIVAHGPAF